MGDTSACGLPLEADRVIQRSEQRWFFYLNKLFYSLPLYKLNSLQT